MSTWVIVCITGPLACAVEDRPPCFVDLPVYDATGNRLPFRVISVAARGDGKEVDLTREPNREDRLRIEGSRVYFPRRAITGYRVRVVLEDAQGNRVVKRIPLLACRQQAPLQFGQLDTGADVGWTVVSGRLIGCQLSADWWVRAMPIFTGPDHAASYVGYVDPKNGSFWLAVQKGVRHIIVIGAGRDPVKTLAANVTVGVKNDIGVVNLEDSCPD